MLSAKRSRNRIPIVLVASSLVCAVLPGVFCPIVCFTHEAATLYGHGGGQVMTMPPCHTGDGVKPAQARGSVTLLALPASGHPVLACAAGPVAVAGPPAVIRSADREIRTPPPRFA